MLFKKKSKHKSKTEPKKIDSAGTTSLRASMFGAGVGGAMGVMGTAAVVGASAGAAAIPAITGGIIGSATAGTTFRKDKMTNVKKHLKKNWKQYAFLGTLVGGGEALKFGNSNMLHDLYTKREPEEGDQ